MERRRRSIRNQHPLFRLDRCFDRDQPRSSHSQRISGSAGWLGCMKRSSGDGVKRSRSRPGISLGGTAGAASAADRPVSNRIAAIR